MNSTTYSTTTLDGREISIPMLPVSDRSIACPADRFEVGVVSVSIHLPMGFSFSGGMTVGKTHEVSLTCVIGHRDGDSDNPKRIIASTYWDTKTDSLETAIARAQDRFPGLEIVGASETVATGYILPRAEWLRFADREMTKRANRRR